MDLFRKQGSTHKVDGKACVLKSDKLVFDISSRDSCCIPGLKAGSPRDHTPPPEAPGSTKAWRTAAVGRLRRGAHAHAQELPAAPPLPQGKRRGLSATKGVHRVQRPRQRSVSERPRDGSSGAGAGVL